MPYTKILIALIFFNGLASGYVSEIREKRMPDDPLNGSISEDGSAILVMFTPCEGSVNSNVNIKDFMHQQVRALNQKVERGGIPDCVDENGTKQPFCYTSKQCASWSLADRDQGKERYMDNLCALILRERENTVNGTPNANPKISPDTFMKPTSLEVWGYGLLSVALISLSAVLGVAFLPLMRTKYYARLMQVLIGLAVGSLTATSTFQLIPEGFKLKTHDPNYLHTALILWGSFWIFYMFESVFKIINQTKKKSPVKTDGVLCRKAKSLSLMDLTGCQPEVANSLLPTTLGHKVEPMATCIEQTNGLLQEQADSLPKKPHNHEHKNLEELENASLATVAWMIIFGDGLHNFIDGMSIGAGFTESIMTGVSISIAIACEEFPHELGDFAILIKSGMSLKRALLMNFLSACTAFLGLALGIVLGELNASIYIFAFAGGLFLYISLSDLMPELRRAMDEAMETNAKSCVVVLLMQNIGILAGMFTVYLITQYNDEINFSDR